MPQGLALASLVVSKESSDSYSPSWGLHSFDEGCPFRTELRQYACVAEEAERLLKLALSMGSKSPCNAS